MLWNIVADNLLEDLNAGVSSLPKAVFYADDGALLYSDPAEIPAMLQRVDTWCTENGIELNVLKCGHVAASYSGDPIYWGDQPIPRLDKYRYLGFPVTPGGIDFEAYIEHRFDQAVARASFMARHSASWGTANRLRAYKQYLAPIIEYGAPLVWAWSAGLPTRWTKANAKWKELIQWIAYGKHAWRLSQNLLGLPSLEDRFETLHMTFLFDLQCTDWSNPLHGLLFRPGQGGTLRKALRESKLLTAWKRQAGAGALDKASLQRFQRDHLARKIVSHSRRTHLGSIVLWDTRIKTGMAHADGTLNAPRHMQDAFFQYRRGVWCFRFGHECAYSSRTFRRGDEECACQRGVPRLSRRDRIRKEQQRGELGCDSLFTDVDFLLNIGEWARADDVLRRARANLTAYLTAKREMESDASDAGDP